MLDTGTTQSILHSDLVTDDDLLDESTTVRCAHGALSLTPWHIAVRIGGKKVIVNAAVSSTLPQSAIIGWDAPSLLHLLPKAGNRQLCERVGVGPGQPTDDIVTGEGGRSIYTSLYLYPCTLHYFYHIGSREHMISVMPLLFHPIAFYHSLVLSYGQEGQVSHSSPKLSGATRRGGL